MKWTTRPLSDLTGFDGGHKPSPFGVSWIQARDLLERELTFLSARDVVMELDLRENQLRNDGTPRADAKAASGRVRLAFESRHGALVYATDRFRRRWGTQMAEHWQHNVYAIAKGLEALRLVDRYGVTTGQQYSGFKALPAGRAMPASHMTTEAAAELVRSYGQAGDSLHAALRAAQRRLHPDMGRGSVDDWHRLEEARRVLGL